MSVKRPYRIVLFGHRDLSAHEIVEKRLSDLLYEVARTEDLIEIYIGRNGEFDIFAASVVKRAKRAFGAEKIDLICVLPYEIKDLEYLEAYYDSIICPISPQKTHPKAAIGLRNRWMAENADLFVCYVERNQGGAYAAMQHARKLGRKTVNLAEDREECALF